jgi:hypothetical protein
MPNRSTQSAHVSHRIVASHREIADSRCDIVTSRREIAAPFREIASPFREIASARRQKANLRGDTTALAVDRPLCSDRGPAPRADIAPLDHHDLPRPVKIADRRGRNAWHERGIAIHAQDTRPRRAAIAPHRHDTTHHREEAALHR